MGSSRRDERCFELRSSSFASCAKSSDLAPACSLFNITLGFLLPTRAMQGARDEHRANDGAAQRFDADGNVGLVALAHERVARRGFRLRGRDARRVDDPARVGREGRAASLLEAHHFWMCQAARTASSAERAAAASSAWTCGASRAAAPAHRRLAQPRLVHTALAAAASAAAAAAAARTATSGGDDGRPRAAADEARRGISCCSARTGKRHVRDLAAGLLGGACAAGAS